MSERRLLPLYVALLVFAFSLLTWLASPVSICAKRKPASSSGSGKWAVILSPGPQTGVPWGGYHVTITGYSNANGGPAKRDSLKNAFNSVFHGTPWHLHGNLPALKNWKGTYTQIVKSRTLDDLADRLVAEGFDRVKGPSHSGTPWHISLNGDHAASKRKVEAFKHGKTNWYLWQVPEPDKACQDHGTGCPRWQKIH